MNRKALWFGIVAILGLLPGMPAAGQGDADWSAWGSVYRFRGTATIEVRGWRNWNDGRLTDKADEFATANVSFVLERARVHGVSAEHSFWEAVGPIHVQGATSISTLTRTWDYRLHYESRSDFEQDLSPEADLHLSFNNVTGEYELSLPNTLAQAVPERWSRSEWTWLNGADISTGVNENRSFVSTNFNGTAPRQVTALRADVLLQRDAQPDDPGDMSSATVGSVTLWPEYEDVVLEVSTNFIDTESNASSQADDELAPLIAPGETRYVNWRPRGSISKPGTPGNRVNLAARLHWATASSSSGPDASSLPDVRYFRFELVDTSREPGIAMNWPRLATDSDLDFRLQINGDLGEMDEERQVFEVAPSVDSNGYPSARAAVESFDFGGRTELRVTAELQDGRTIHAFYTDGDRRYGELLLPKRWRGDWIAEGWRSDHDVASQPADDDSDNEPEGDGDAGDGLTLYEEYRGFVVRKMPGSRVEGDPKKKELFVLNLIGSDAWPALRTFEDVTRLHVIHKLDRAELDPDLRVINENYRDAPHLTQQHGIVLKTVRRSSTVADTPALKPATARVVSMRPTRTFKGADVYESDIFSYMSSTEPYRLELVHRMLHTVGVSDHGGGDETLTFRVIPANYKGNLAEKPLLLMDGTTDRLFDLRVESTGRSLYESDRGLGQQLDEIAQRQFGESFIYLDQLQQWQVIHMVPPTRMRLGIESGQHSGGEQCPMRYLAAHVYRAKGLVKTPRGKQATGRETYYWFASTWSRESRDAPWALCESPVGTGYNSQTRDDPQPRFGDAAQGRGNCMAQLCVSDAIAPHLPGGGR